jgi:carbamoyltransferase
MYILGINAYHADASACIYHNEKLIAAAEEERFRRPYHCHRILPKRSWHQH